MQSLAMVVFYGALIWAFDSLGVHPDVALRGATLNYTFSKYGPDEPAVLSRTAQAHGTVLVLDVEDPKPYERNIATEMGYSILIQAIALTGIEVNVVTLARIHLVFFLGTAFVFAWLVGFILKQVFPVSYVILVLMVVFRHHCESLLYHFLGLWTFATTFPLLTMSSGLLMYTGAVSRSWRWRVMAFGSAAVICGLMVLVRESEGYICLFASCLVAVLLYRWRCLRSRKITAVLLIALLAGHVILPRVIMKSLILHRAAKTSLQYKQYGEGTHGAFWSLLLSLGRYENPYGWYADDNFVLETAVQELQRRGFAKDESQARGMLFRGPTYRAVIRDYYIRQVVAHPVYFLRYLAHGTWDYCLYLPYVMFLNDPVERTLGKTGDLLPIVRRDVEIDPNDRGYGGYTGTGEKPLHVEGLINLKPRYLYLHWWEWLLFGLTVAGVFVAPFGLYRWVDKRARIVMTTCYITFGLTSLMRILVPLHGETAVMAYFAVFAVNASLLASRAANALPTRITAAWARRPTTLPIGVALLVLALVSSRGALGPLAHTRGCVLSERIVYPRLLVEGYLGYNIVQYDGRFFGCAQGMVGGPPYGDPKMESHPQIVIGASIDETKALIKARVSRGDIIPQQSSTTVTTTPDHQPKLLEEGYLGYNVVRFDGRYYGFPQGFSPDYSDPHLADHPGVIVADSPQEVRRRILTERPD